MKKLSNYILEHSPAYLGAILCLICSVTLDMLSPQVTRRIIDDVIGGRKLALLPPLLGCILCIGIGRFVFQYIKEYTFDITGAKISASLREDLFNHLQSLSADFFDRNNTGELMARVKDDVDHIWDGLTYVGMLLIEVAVHVTMVLYCMYSLHWKLALLPTIAMLLCGALAVFLEKKLDNIYEEISEENAVLNTVAEENLEGIRTVKAFAREKFEIDKFMSHNKRYYELNMAQSRMFVKYHPLFTLVTKILPLLVLLIGGYLVINGGTTTNGETFTLGTLGAFIEYSNNIVWPMEMLGWLTNSFSSAVASNRKIKKLYAQHPTVSEPENPIEPDRILGDIVFENVSFVRDNTEILKEISFHVKPGQTLGIMGATGSGKTSIIQLLERLYDCTDGRILLDGTDIRSLRLNTLRSSIAVVMQDVFLFSDTIDENVRMGKQDVLTKEAIAEASTKAQASDFIERLEDGYDTVIGERGVGLSGGQKQRISIARALSKADPILVMDDSTSALDMETEHRIQQTLRSLEHTTKLIVAHRISAVRHADQILFLENGRIAESGTHEELLARKGLYYETYCVQYNHE